MTDNFERNLIAVVNKCVSQSCEGWLVDSILGKYFIPCLDPRPNMTKKQVENVGQSMLSTNQMHNSAKEEHSF
jgi:hypothetical protein